MKFVSSSIVCFLLYGQSLGQTKTTDMLEHRNNKELRSLGIGNPNPNPSQTQSSSSLTLESGSAIAFPYVIPYNQTQSCNIYGPLCQTGQMTVGMTAFGPAQAKTTLSCSSYLTAQASHLARQTGYPDQDLPNFPAEWLTGFGRSPQCKSYASIYNTRGVYTFPGCPLQDAPIRQQTTDLLTLPSQIPPGVLNKQAGDFWQCCGNCSFQIQELRLYYFPDENASAYCQSKNLSLINGHSAPPFSGSIAELDIPITINPLAPTGSVAVESLARYTFTSPSLYLQVVGTAAIRDQCGPLSPTITTEPFIAVPSGQLSTYSVAAYTLGECFLDPQGFLSGAFIGENKPLNVADLDCPTYGLGPGGTASDGSPCSTVGPPYLPLIVPPAELLDLSPAWRAACPGILSHSAGLKSFAIADTRRVLQAAAGLVPPHERLLRPRDGAVTAGPESLQSSFESTTTAAAAVIRPAAVPTAAKGPAPTTVTTAPASPESRASSSQAAERDSAPLQWALLSTLIVASFHLFCS